MNWGNRIALVITLFVAGILFMVFKAGTFNTDLVATDYYEQELQYQKVIDAGERADNLSSQVKVNQLSNQLEILLPEEMQGKTVSADIWLYCVADKSKDRRKKMQTNDGKLFIELLPANKGAYEIKLDWESEKVSYYFKEKLKL
jgi:hypothetical protein